MDKLLHKDPVTGELMCDVRNFGKIFDTLHAYEETGLTPEQIEALKIDKLNLISMVEQLEKARAERDALVEQLRMCTQEGLEPCDLCRFGTNPEYSGECDFECATCANKCPCSGCKNGEKWEWRGAKDIDVPTKEEA